MNERRLIGVGLIIVSFLSQGCLNKLYQLRQKGVSSDFEQFNFKDLTKRYFQKDQTSDGTIEGIYSVSIVIIKKGKSLFSSTEKEKTVERRENFSKVAIFRDRSSGSREYIEISMDKELLPSYSIIGEFSHTNDGSLLVYKHFEHNGKNFSYTFSYDRETDLLEGVRTENSGSSTFTYKLTYIKLSSKVK